MRTVRILAVEDNPADIELVREALSARALAHSLEVASDFDEARAYIQSIVEGSPRPDVILLDLNLPKGSGMELLKLLRAVSEFQRVPVIIVTSSNSVRDRDSAARLGAARYFRKPTDFEEFMTLGPLVESVLADSAAS